MKKSATADYEIHPLIHERWSPRAFSSAPVEELKLRSLLEAARWAASCINEQPWHFIVAQHQDQLEFARLLHCLAEANQRWAKQAAVLMVSVAKRNFSHSGMPNYHALHDVGLATAQLMLQATALGLVVHPMAGFSSDRIVQEYEIPAEFEPVAAIAIGYPGDPHMLPDDLREREMAPRSRKPQPDFVFAKTWGSPH